MKRISLFAFCCLLFAAPAAAQDNSPSVLSAADINTYRSIFDEQAAGHLAEADALIAKLNDPVLMGYVLEQRFFTRDYVSNFDELNSWLGKYGDLAGAGRVHALALKKKPKTLSKGVRLASPTPTRRRGQRFDDEALIRSPPQSAKGQRVRAQLRGLVQENRTDKAEAVLLALASGPDLPAQDFDRLFAYVAAVYLAECKDIDALRVAENAFARGAAPLSRWTAGLATFRLGQFENSARHFEAISQANGVGARNFSRSAFWAARAWIHAGNTERVASLYARAASEPNTFYGMLAARLLGREAGPNMVEPSLDADSIAALMQNKAARRAVALWEVGQTSPIEPELSRAFGEISPKLDPAFAGLARLLGAPSLELRAAETAANRELYLTSLYPVPAYIPTGGYRIDRAIVLAFARQESRFIADAASKSGARGLMQLMPMTAAKMDPSLARGKKDRLDDPAYNMGLGQDHLSELLDLQNGNLLNLAAAYNAGTGNLSKWQAMREGNDDPLLFIETLPVPETRDFVKRVMMNFWMYRKRLGQPLDGLDDIAAGEWPTYQPTDTVAAR